MSNDVDVIVIGAGAAGLTASAALGRAGFSTKIIEARDRIGGRIFTMFDPRFNAPVELGAEFIHGRPKEIWDRLRRQRIRIREVKGDSWCAEDGRLTKCNFFSDVDEILGKMKTRKRDESFLEFLDHRCPTSEAKRLQQAKEWATRYVTGFNAADPALVGVNWLVKEMRAEERIEGDKAFRAQHGYEDLLRILQQDLSESGVVVQKSTLVESIRWRTGHVEVTARQSKGAKIFSAKRVLVTVPLGVLQARPDDDGAIAFIPGLPRQKQDAIAGKRMGKVIRVTMRFRERFWKDLRRTQNNKSETLANMNFLFSRDEWFPTWWTMAPEKLPFLTGWAPFRCAERLSGQSTSFVVEKALRTLHRLFGVGLRELENLFEAAYSHDWEKDRLSRGAYSYGTVGGNATERELARPVKNTLFFAGEATDLAGHTATVHGAIASGERAAREIIKAASGTGRK